MDWDLDWRFWTDFKSSPVQRPAFCDALILVQAWKYNSELTFWFCLPYFYTTLSTTSQLGVVDGLCCHDITIMVSLCSQERCSCWSCPGEIHRVFQLHLVGLWFWIQGQVYPYASQHNPEKGRVLPDPELFLVCLHVKSFLSLSITCSSASCCQLAYLDYSSIFVAILCKSFYAQHSQWILLASKLCTVGPQKKITDLQCIMY